MIGSGSTWHDDEYNCYRPDYCVALIMVLSDQSNAAAPAKKIRKRLHSAEEKRMQRVQRNKRHHRSNAQATADTNETRRVSFEPSNAALIREQGRRQQQVHQQRNTEVHQQRNTELLPLLSEPHPTPIG
jgi:hypothetical protein